MTNTTPNIKPNTTPDATSNTSGISAKKTTSVRQYQTAKGTIDYTLLNDYMFHAVLQNNETVLRGFIGSLLHLKQEEILCIEIKNPIIIGEDVNDKEFILDIQILLNTNTCINLELQVLDEGNWTDRSLSYLCRSFDQLYRGQKYEETIPVIHIGILNYTLFPDTPEFYSTNMLMNVKNHKIFNDKFILNVLCLNQINTATETDKRWHLDAWAQLFKSKTWEDIKMIAQNNTIFAEAAESLYQYNTDDIIRQRCRAREEYERHERTVNKKINDLTTALAESESALAESESALAEKNKRIAELEALLKEKQ